ncbi:hypothetical protein VTK73DRAFT_4987 [Phialemonium thermophilum]|uniref:Uncharacterized protein n=1 Tax=Phialemonium thermophilum TaxID=223376 RepID=A0ABR3XXT8_9PEZI
MLKKFLIGLNSNACVARTINTYATSQTSQTLGANAKVSPTQVYWLSSGLARGFERTEARLRHLVSKRFALAPTDGVVK